MSALQSLLQQIAEERRSLTQEEARNALNAILTGAPDSVSDLEISSLLSTIATRGETIDELTGFVLAMRALSVPIPLTPDERAALVDTCGTGGDGLGTFNISTGAALVAAAAGAKVAKHGNRGITSKCGSADVLEALGISVALTPEQSADCLRATGFTFLYAPALHPALKRVQPVRRALGFRTIFNLAGPLTNPAGAPAQIMGVYSPTKLEVAAGVMAQLGIRFGRVVHARNGIDEIALSPTDTIVVRPLSDHGPPHPFSTLIYPEDLGLSRATLEDLQGGDTPESNAAILEGILSGGETGPKREVVLVNAAAALEAVGLAADLHEGVLRAAEAIDSGSARRTLEALRDFGRSVAAP
ncbi:MAG TPA: anthranilate phosphoribosyltransferase [Acidobacteriaceae bacterium]|jgi:anthranilate phosphoribosyltransferase|nr:anthranilate phosphoribosyltransferase [Acidobacteriaceae bacterium]